MRICGIDLGTTNSCIVVVAPGKHVIVPCDGSSLTVPSVAFAGRDGKVVIGSAARARMGEQPGPVATIKRKMGSTETVTLGGKTYTPVEVSAAILSHLRETAEKYIGEPITRAVVTVPAYFDHVQRQQTDEAARKAGFEDVITMLEPVAAALAHSLDNAKDQLRVFVYDLGGGTFDATVLEKDSYGGLSVLSFGGDPHLGGDDIDARLVNRLLGLLRDQGYALDLNLSNPADYSRYQRLKFYAENAKKDLSGAESTHLIRQGFFEDQNGAIVDLDLTITRQDLEECCRDLIQRSIDASLATLRKADRHIEISSIDEVIMVGGMSRMPLAQRMLSEALGRETKIVNPDLIVGIGAAIKAAEAFTEQVVASSGLKVELRFDRRTDEDSTTVSGVFDRVVRGYTAFLSSARDEMYQTVDGSDRFTFENVALTCDSVNVFHLSVEDVDEKPILQREIRIEHSGKTVPILSSPGSVVTKAIAVETVTGSQILLPENTALPHEVTYQFYTNDQGGKIIAPILEADREVACIEIAEIPATLPPGTPVLIHVSVHSDYRIEARAEVRDIQREVKIDFRILPTDTSDVTPAYVRRRLAEIEDQSRRAVSDCPSPDAIAEFEFRRSMIRDEVEVELSEMEPKPTKLLEKLTLIEQMLRRLPRRSAGIQLNPSFDTVNEKLTAAVSRAIETKHSKLKAIQPQLDPLRAEAREAWAVKDPIRWRRVAEQVDAICGELLPEIPLRHRVQGMAALIVGEMVPELREASGGQATTEIGEIEMEATKVFAFVQAGVMEPEEAIGKLVTLFQNRVRPLRQRLGLTDIADPIVTGQSGAVATGHLRT